jgi:hypothetical protein
MTNAKDLSSWSRRHGDWYQWRSLLRLLQPDSANGGRPVRG